MEKIADKKFDSIAADAFLTFLTEFSEVVNISGVMVNLKGERISEEINPAFSYSTAYIPNELFDPQKVIALINRSVNDGYTNYKGLTIVPFPISIQANLSGFILLIDKADVTDNSLVCGNQFLTQSSFTVDPRNSQAIEAKSVKMAKLFFKMVQYVVCDFSQTGLAVHQIEELKAFQHRCDSQEEIAKATAYIHSNLDKPLSLKEVADQVYFSQSYFSKLFKKEMGINFVEYLNAQRIKEACRLLEFSDLKIDDISRRVGFSQASYFCKIFKDLTQVSPATYRKQCKKGYAV